MWNIRCTFGNFYVAFQGVGRNSLAGRCGFECEHWTAQFCRRASWIPGWEWLWPKLPPFTHKEAGGCQKRFLWNMSISNEGRVPPKSLNFQPRKSAKWSTFPICNPKICYNEPKSSFLGEKRAEAIHFKISSANEAGVPQNQKIFGTKIKFVTGGVLCSPGRILLTPSFIIYQIVFESCILLKFIF